MTLGIVCAVVLGLIALVQTLRLWAYQRTLGPLVADLEAMTQAMKALSTITEAVGRMSPDDKTPPG